MAALDKPTATADSPYEGDPRCCQHVDATNYCPKHDRRMCDACANHHKVWCDGLGRADEH